VAWLWDRDEPDGDGKGLLTRSIDENNLASGPGIDVRLGFTECLISAFHAAGLI